MKLKKKNYAIFIDLLADFFVKSKQYKDLNAESESFKEIQSKFSVIGANLSVFASKELYNES